MLRQADEKNSKDRHYLGMSWRVAFSSDALKFLARNSVSEEAITEKVAEAIRMFQGERVNIQIKKLGGQWEGFYRIRRGRVRIIVEFQFEDSIAYI